MWPGNGAKLRALLEFDLYLASFPGTPSDFQVPGNEGGIYLVCLTAALIHSRQVCQRTLLFLHPDMPE